MKTIATVLEYHDRTKHRSYKYAASLGYMDWATQPDPFRRYEGSPLLSLPFSDITPPYHLLFERQSLPKAPLCLESVAHLLRYSLGLAAWKGHSGTRWALRCNASSGNLHPTECYLITPPVEGICQSTSLFHYAPKEHGIEHLNTFKGPIEGLPEGSFLIALSSVIWREAWKYGERCWRYCQLDAGHAYHALRISAKTLGWHCHILSTDTAQIAQLCGLDQYHRYDPKEHESPDMLILISPSVQSSIHITLPTCEEIAYKANQLSPSHHDWPILDIIDEATCGEYPSPDPLYLHPISRAPSRSAGEIILKRRSAQMMDGSGITKEAFLQLLGSTHDLSDAPYVNFILFVHRVEGIESGLYLYLRNASAHEGLKEAMHDYFEYQEISEHLYLLKKGDYRGAAQMISCNQEIAKEGAFSFGMVCDFTHPLETFGAPVYKSLYHQCGALGQQLYLEATSLGLSATGIGCFLDDEFHHLLGIKNESYQSLYHFTIGRAVIDTRITTEPPYR